MAILDIIQKCSTVAKTRTDEIQGYGTGTLGCVSGVDLAQILGGVILVSRLLVDVPQAYDYVKARFFTKKKAKRKKK